MPSGVCVQTKNMPKGEKHYQYGKHLSKKIRKKISNSLKGRFLGKKLTEETKRKISIANKGKICSKETKKKMSIAKKGKKLSKKHCKALSKARSKACTGRKLSAEHKANIKKARAKLVLPIKDTSIEIKIQNFLNQMYETYHKHKYMKIKHAYRCDIFIPRLNLVIECDGNYWHNYPMGSIKDMFRTAELKKVGYNVLRLWESEIKKMNLENFKDSLKIYKNLYVAKF